MTEINPESQYGEIIEPSKRKAELFQIVYHLMEYVAVMRDEPAGQLIKFDSVYHDLNRILGNEV